MRNEFGSKPKKLPLSKSNHYVVAVVVRLVMEGKIIIPQVLVFKKTKRKTSLLQLPGSRQKKKENRTETLRRSYYEIIGSPSLHAWTEGTTFMRKSDPTRDSKAHQTAIFISDVTERKIHLRTQVYHVIDEFEEVETWDPPFWAPLFPIAWTGVTKEGQLRNLHQASLIESLQRIKRLNYAYQAAYNFADQKRPSLSCTCIVGTK